MKGRKKEASQCGAVSGESHNWNPRISHLPSLRRAVSSMLADLAVRTREEKWKEHLLHMYEWRSTTFCSKLVCLHSKYKTTGEHGYILYIHYPPNMCMHQKQEKPTYNFHFIQISFFFFLLWKKWNTKIKVKEQNKEREKRKTCSSPRQLTSYKLYIFLLCAGRFPEFSSGTKFECLCAYLIVLLLISLVGIQLPLFTWRLFTWK